MALKPWHTVIHPREDLREGKPLDASEFAVHLDQVRDGRAPAVYQKPKEFFDRTFLTQNLTVLAAEVLRRLSGITTEANAVFNLATQFGGGKTHALTLLYHLAERGSAANGWRGVSKLLERAELKTVPRAEKAVFVGTEFDSIAGRRESNDEPLRRTPWGEIAWQLGRHNAFQVVAVHDEQLTAPAGDVIRRFLPTDKPCLILLDEVMNYVSRHRKSGLAAQFYNFLQNLSEEARGRNNVVLVISVPKSEYEMTAEDEQDYLRFTKLLDRLGKAVMMSSESETSEIIRRRLFEWESDTVSSEGKILLNRDAINTCNAYANWMVEQRNHMPSWFPIDSARAAFEATYPFHPVVLSVFERKWQALPRFQRTRGVLRLLALWVAHAYPEGYKGAHRDPLIGLGTAPLDNTIFRAAVFDQLGESRLEAAVTTDICGKNDSFATRLDKEAPDTIKNARLHRKIATSIFFESNGGQARGEASPAEIRLAVADPTIDIGSIEPIIEALAESCYYLSIERNRYRFSLAPNLNRLLADRRANISASRINDCLRAEIQKVFKAGTGIHPVFFPEKSNQISNQPVLVLAVMPPEQSFEEKSRVISWVDKATREVGDSSRTFKSAIIWAVPESYTALAEEARKLLAWEEIADEVAAGSVRLDEGQQRQLSESVKKAERDLKEAVWRNYKNILLLGRDNQMREIDLGLVNSSAANSLMQFIINRLEQSEEIQKTISPNFLRRNWPPAFQEWSTRAVRDAFFASPQFPRLLNAEAIKETIARGVSEGLLAYVGKDTNGGYEPFYFRRNLSTAEIEINDEVFIITKDQAETYQQSLKAPSIDKQPLPPLIDPSPQPGSGDGAAPVALPFNRETEKVTPPIANVTHLSWQDEIPAQKWSTFYTKVLSKYATGKGLRLTLNLQVDAAEGISTQKIEETKTALRELGLNENVEVK